MPSDLSRVTSSDILIVISAFEDLTGLLCIHHGMC